MSAVENTNIFKYTDYKVPTLHYNSDYRTSTGRAIRSCSTKCRNFIFQESKNLCDVIAIGGKNTGNPHRFVSEKMENFSWKINSSRNKREELAPALVGVEYVAQNCEKIDSNDVIIPSSSYRKEEKTFKNLFDEPVIPQHFESQPRFMWKTSFNTDTEGSYRFMDPLLSTTSQDFILHKDYLHAKTNLITHDSFTFNSDKNDFIPTSFLLKTYPICNKYSSNIIRDTRKFPVPIRDHLVPRKWDFVPSSFTTEIRSNY
jgi:hypothetical protein